MVSVRFHRMQLVLPTVMEYVRNSIHLTVIHLASMVRLQYATSMCSKCVLLGV